MSTVTPNERFAYMLESLVHHKLSGFKSLNHDVVEKMTQEVQVSLYELFHKMQFQLGERAIDVLSIEMMKSVNINEKSFEQMGFFFPNLIDQVPSSDLRILAELCSECEFGEKFRKTLSLR